jgi:hypothetical protein
MRPRVILPLRSCGSRSRTVLLGTANPMPMFPSDLELVMIAVFMPITSPRRLSSGPPELPGLIAASVCSMSFVRPSVIGNARDVALMTPTVTVWSYPNGLPIAITQSPASICEESPNFASDSGRFGFSTSWISALSVSGSRPMTFAW